MTRSETIPVIDGHNDTLTKLRHGEETAVDAFLARRRDGHLDMPRARTGGLVAGFFAIFTASPAWRREKNPVLDEDGETVPGAWSVPLPSKLDPRSARRFTLAVMSDLFRLVSASEGDLRIIRDVEGLDRSVDRREDGLGVILHIEGAEAIDSRLETLDVLYEAGLRSLGPVWSRPNVFGHGVPFDFPRHPDTGPGLTTAGRRLIRRCNELGILVDCSHLNAQGFWDVARVSEAPIVATHSNAHALCPSPRNLTDAQLDVIALSGGVVGLNFAVGFLREDGRSDPDTPLSTIAGHARYVADLVGVEHVALGSDFDGAEIPHALGDASGLPRLMEALREAGFSEPELERISYGNWRRVLEATWRR
ncbi:MAG: dipeptidase [Longimicrobiales bacterium]|nr:dipeptidase [Longimicrobiales bacterium]